jgi:hypothetical protein
MLTHNVSRVLPLPANPPQGYGFGKGSKFRTLTPTLAYPWALPLGVSIPLPFTSGGAHARGQVDVIDETGEHSMVWSYAMGWLNATGSSFCII